MLLLLQDKKQQQGSKRAVTLPPNRRLGVTVPCQNQGRRDEVLSRHHAEAGCVHVGTYGLPDFCLSVEVARAFPSGVRRSSRLSRRCPPRSTAAKLQSACQVDQWKGSWSVGQAPTRCPGGGTGVRTRLLDARLMSRGGRAGRPSQSPKPRSSSRADIPVPSQLPSCQLSDLHPWMPFFSSCLAHRARAGREYHPHLSACATAAAVLCGSPQIWRVSLCVLRWGPKTAELQARILMVFPRGRGLRCEGSAALTLAEQRSGLAVNGWVWLK